MSLKTNTGFQVTLLLNSSHPVILGTDYLISKRIVLDFFCCSKYRSLIWGKLPAKCIYGQHGICTNNSYLVKSGLWVSKTVVTVNKTNTVPLKILNPSNDTIFVPRGKVIATFQCFTTDFNLLNPRVDTNVCAQDVQLQSESSECESRFDSKFISYFDIPAHLSADEK